MTRKSNVIELPPVESVRPKRSFVERWGNHPALFNRGFVVVPSLFLQVYARLKPEITPGEALFILHLMEFKWDADHPYPGYKTLARRMGRSEKAAQTHARDLEIKGYLRRQIRRNDTNKFDLTPLFDALLAKATEIEKSEKSRIS